MEEMVSLACNGDDVQLISLMEESLTALPRIIQLTVWHSRSVFVQADMAECLNSLVVRESVYISPDSDNS
jgi:hypothetical protein